MAGTNIVHAAMRDRHPELSDSAIEALAWDFSFTMK